MNLLKVALLQMTATKDQQESLEKAEKFCREAKQGGADIALLPELWSTGYAARPESDLEAPAWEARAITQGDDYQQHFMDLAAGLDMAIVLTFLERDGKDFYNSASLIDRHGKMLFTYRKVHTVDKAWERHLTPGNDYFVAELDTAQGLVKVGIMTCYDREFPEVARILMLKGAEIILTPNACEIEPNRIAQFRTRAYENMVGVAMTNYAAPNQNGHSIAFDGMRVKGAYHDPLIIQAGEEEGIFMADFDLEKLRTYRKYDIWGNAYRKPKTYSSLLDMKVDEPFIRSDARR